MRIVFGVLLAGMLAGGLRAQAQQRVVLVELFTSEGCSSCPPADALLKELNGTRSAAGQLIVGISEHVTYWNNLGWADPFSAESYTQRQDGYAGRFGLDSVYTPQVVVNGAAQLNGTDAEAIKRAMVRVSDTGAAALKISTVEAGSDGRLAVTFALEGLPASGADVYAVIADDMATSSVLRGENSGRTLSHVSVARSLTRVATLKEAKTMTVSLAVPGVVKGQPETKRHLILFAQEKGQGKVLAAEAKGI